MREPGRLITAMATPFCPDGSLDLDGTARLARHLVETGTECVVVSGTTGESPTLSHDEKLTLLDVVLGAVGDRIPVMMGTGTNSTSDSVTLTREAHQHGAGAALLVVPYYNKPTQEGLFQHFSTIAGATPIPVMLYNVPSRTVADLLPETVVRLSGVPNIFAVKEASGQVARTAEILSQARAGFRVYSGDDSLTLPILSLGGYGVVSVLANLSGEPLRAMIDAYLQGRPTVATEIHLAILPLLKALFITANPIPLKSALGMLGLPAGVPRLPLVSATPSEEAVIRKALDCLKIRFCADLAAS